MRASILGGVLATALMVGCGPAMEQEEAPDLATQEAPLPDCANSPDYLTMYFSDGSYSEQIGGRGCHCGWWESWGRTSAYRQILNEC
ncbi:hypothetical protein OV208_05720 [Corallococcus sp. bb12-1]|uniref:hypothetical protein n=1 Tax=Corallococcus sp. bb12-1 TaxID=2996784 RepID=UPI00226D4A16|nr:hypothetical protein [Corallococcus sp. bb12-1]MCY1040815.1 hypothetical protein [Corallococcus sp. bb12-1]